MHAMMENLPTGMRVVFINVEDFSSPAEFVTALMSAFYANHRNIFVKKLSAGWDLLTDLLGRVELSYEEFRVNLRDRTKGTDFRILGDQFITNIEKSGTNVLFLIDELPDMIHHLKDRDMEITVTFLHWLRRIINQQEIYRFWRARHAPDYSVSPNDVQLVFNETLMGERVRDKFLYFRHRLRIYYPQNEQAIACEILDKLSVSQNGFNLSGLLAIFNSVTAKMNINMTDPKGELFRLLLNLENDFYVRRQDGNIYDFENLLLKKWWAYYYGMDA
ncbi:MAG: hypothetical protein MJE63_13230, partial [Proteobacteria bacterium]|nr:hypothetical protein [Pseudomonadota bacterium]